MLSERHELACIIEEAHLDNAFLLLFRKSTQSAILNFMRLAPMVSMLVKSLALNGQTIQGKVVRVADGDTITILDVSVIFS